MNGAEEERKRAARAEQVALFRYQLSAPRGALLYRPRSGHGLEEVSVGLMAHLDP